jgi:hypothetical protein
VDRKDADHESDSTRRHRNPACGCRVGDGDAGRLLDRPPHRGREQLSVLATHGPGSNLEPDTNTDPSLTPGATTHPLPAGITTMTVTFLLASDSFSTPPAAILWQRTVNQQPLIAQVVAMVDTLQETTATQGCTSSNVMLRLDFSSLTEHATLDENSPCARATLVIDGTAGPVLASSVIFQVEQLVGVQATTVPDGQPSVTSIG